jgi:pyridoxine 5-phosphate synthase
MTRISVNINKIATLRNARGGDVPNVLQCALDIERFGADGITVHPRPDERHIRYSDVRDLRPELSTEFNIEGNPNEQFIALVLEAKPEQVTLVPDAPDVLTSNAGWKVSDNLEFLQDVVGRFKEVGIRVSIFMDADEEEIALVKKTGTDRIELYTESYASGYGTDREQAIAPFITAAKCATENRLGINAGHDLDLQNLKYFDQNIPGLLEVSIGHALIAEALYLGLENAVQLYKRELQ